jgi:uncharacterized tellurite resistance protein B-like protein
MSNTNVILSLAKVMVAAAWADGEITNDEINCLKDLLFHMKGMTAQDWAVIDIYIESPVEAAERQRLEAELESLLSSPEERAKAIEALDHMMEMGGGVNPSEQAVLDEIKSSIQTSQSGGMKHWSLFTRSKVNSQSQAVQTAPNREQYLDDFVKNKIYYDVSRQLVHEAIPTQISENELRKLSLAGGLLARVAYVDRQVTAEENKVIMQVLQKHWGISQVEAAVVAEMAASEIGKGLDYYRLTRQFYEATTEDEREDFLDALFAVAAGDRLASFEEIEEIRTIANGFLMSHKQFIDAKLRLSSDQRID